MRSSVPDLCRVGQEIRRRTPSCSPRAEEGCAHSGAVGGKRAGSFPSLTPAGPWWRWWGCVRHEGGSVAAAAVAVAAGGSRRYRSRHRRKHRPVAGKHGNKGGVWQQQWATGTESAEPRGYRAASPATPPGVGGVGTRFLRTGSTVLWQLSEQTLQRRSHSPIGESTGATCGTLSGKPILGTLFGARRDVVGDRPV